MTLNELMTELNTVPEQLRDSTIQISTGYNDLEKISGVGIIANIPLKEIKLSFY